MGRPAFKPNDEIREMVYTCAGFGMGWDELTAAVNHHLFTLKDDPASDNPKSVVKRLCSDIFKTSSPMLNLLCMLWQWASSGKIY